MSAVTSSRPKGIRGNSLSSHSKAIRPIDAASFSCCFLLPAEVEPAAVALRSKAFPILDLAPQTAKADIRRLTAALERRLGDADRKAAIGFRFSHAGHAAALARTLADLWPGAVIVAACRDPAEAEAMVALASDWPIVVESGAPEVLALAAAEADLAGIIAVGEEAGGWCGRLSSLLVAREMARLAEAQQAMAPWLLRGGLGPQGAAAAAVAGAAGVVLDDVLWLLDEVSLSSALRRVIDTLDGKEAMVLGEPLGAPLRVVVHPRFPASRALEAEAQRIEASALSAGDARAAWIEAAEAALAEPGAVLVAGQAIGLARATHEAFGGLGRLAADVRAVPERLAQQAEALAAALAPGAPLAQAHGCRYPIVQGPMTRVSDRAAFAAAVADAGALPMVALAALRPEETADLMAATSAALGERPWGVGILGFLPPDQLDRQMAEVLKARPPFAVIAGGRAEQALALEAQGIGAYVHAPTAALARLLVDRGVKRLILEGRECGGHVGPLHSIALWQAVTAELVRAGAGKGLSVLLAGGIHDDLTAAMAMAVAAPLIAAGAQVGVLMGTAYLATEEIVAAGAITPAFRQAVVEAGGTANIESGRGHANRCLVSPFVDAFNAERRRLLAAGTAPEPLREALDTMLLGRLRVASKGIARDDGLGSTLQPVSAERQFGDGMFMAGEAAGLIETVQPAAALHETVSAGGAALLRTRAATAPAAGGTPADAAACDIAIIGMALHLPGAATPETFWRNVLDKRSAVSEIPADRWDWRVYEESLGHDAVTSRWGGFMDGIEFDPLRFGIPPKSVPDISTGQLLTLDAVRRAFADAGYAHRPFDRENTCVVVGAEDAGGYIGNELTARALAPLLVGPEALAELRERSQGWTEETFPGILTSVVAGRIANRFDLGGANFTVDSACASSITALSLAVGELTSGRANLAVLAGSDTTQTPYQYTAFSAVTALSPSGKLRAFDQSGDGTMLSEGIAAFILKRREDAERDGDRIYAVIKAVAASSDGRGLGMTAPRPVGQKRALRRAYRASGHAVSELGFYEAHGTGTPVGDRAELETVNGLLTEAGASAESCALGSVKSLIGHTKTAAGAVGLAKVTLALYHRTIPPQPGIETPLAPVGQADSALYIADAAQPWFPGAGPRLAGVSAFGFGGTNAHAVIEEYDPGRPAPLGAAAWPAELVPVAAGDRDGLARQWALLARAAAAGDEVTLAEIAAAVARRVDPAARMVSYAVVGDKAALAEAAAAIAAHLADPVQPLPPDTAVAERGGNGAGPAPLALLFPGQGSQRLQMCRDAAVYLPDLRDSIEAAQAVAGDLLGAPLGRLIYPPATFDAGRRDEQMRRLTDTRVAQIALGAVSAGLAGLLERLGVRADFAAGHSYGEYVALHAAGAIDRDTLFRLSLARGAAMAAAPEGKMCAVSADRAAVQALLADHPGVVIANVNSDRQIVLSGAPALLDAAAAALEAAGHACRMLPVGGAFHSPLMEGARGPLSDAIAAASFSAPAFPVPSGRDGQPFPSAPEALQKQLAGQITDPVDWVAQVHALYQAGARVFVETGPSGVLSHLTRQILGDKPDVSILTADDGGGLRGVLRLLGALWATGQAVDFAALRGTPFPARSLETLSDLADRQPLPTSWIVDGMTARPARADAPFKARKRNLRTADTPSTPVATPAPAAAAPPQLPASGPPMTQSPPNDLLAAYSEYQATMRQFLKTQEQVMGLMLGGAPLATEVPSAATPNLPLPGVADIPAPATMAPPPPVPAPLPTAAPAPVAAQAPAPAPAPTASGISDRPSAEAALRGIVSDRTGYPAEMIAFDQDIEAEFGIDSIKRLEIIERVIAALPPGGAERFRAGAERTAREKELRLWVDAMVDTLGGADATPGPAPGPAPAAGTKVAETSAPFDSGAARQPSEAAASDAAPPLKIPAAETVAPCPGYVMAARRADLPEAAAKGANALSGLFLIVPGPAEVTEALLAAMGPQGPKLAILPADPDAMPPAIVQARAAHGPVRGILHLAALGADEAATGDAGDWPRLCRDRAKSLYHAVRATLANLAAPGPVKGRVFACSALGGSFGRPDGEGQPPASLAAALGGAAAGFLNSLALEQPQIAARALDFTPGTSPEAIAETLVRELAFEGGRVEVGYPPRGRTVFEAAPFTLPAPPAEPPVPAGAVILATGGVRGITAEVLAGIAAPGARVIALGRRGAPEPEPPETAAAPDAVALRRALAEQALAEGRPTRPAEIEARCAAILRDRAASAALETLRARGIEVEVHATDTRDPAALGALLEDVTRRHGAIHTLVHGAGVIEDKLIADKQPDSFDRVFDTKVAPLPVLLGHPAMAGLEGIVLFASVAGRFGNRGQADYSAANEVLNRTALWAAAQRPEARVVSFNWGPWEGTGMASNSVNAMFRARGIVPIPADVGAAFAAAALAGAAPVELIAGEGDWNRDLADETAPPRAKTQSAMIGE